MDDQQNLAVMELPALPAFDRTVLRPKGFTIEDILWADACPRLSGSMGRITRLPAIKKTEATKPIKQKTINRKLSTI